MEESATVDGATYFQALWHILLPISKPILSVVFLVSFIYFYAEFNIANRFLIFENATFASSQFYNEFFFRPEAIIARDYLLSCIPVLVLFFAVKRWLVSGLSEGSAKG